jgi:hypothetical protein
MSARSKKIHAERREKMATRWPETKKPAVGRIHGRLASRTEIGVLSSRLGRPARQPEQMTDWS